MKQVLCFSGWQRLGTLLIVLACASLAANGLAVAQTSIAEVTSAAGGAAEAGARRNAEVGRRIGGDDGNAAQQPANAGGTAAANNPPAAAAGPTFEQRARKVPLSLGSLFKLLGLGLVVAMWVRAGDWVSQDSQIYALGWYSCVNNGARTRRIRVLKTESYTCPKCEYSWSAEKVGCDPHISSKRRSESAPVIAPKAPVVAPTALHNTTPKLKLAPVVPLKTEIGALPTLGAPPVR